MVTKVDRAALQLKEPELLELIEAIANGHIFVKEALVNIANFDFDVILELIS